MMIFRYALVALLTLSCAMTAQASEPANPLFLTNDTLEAKIVAPIDTIARERSIEEETPGKFYFANEDGSYTELDVQIRARGNFRRQPGVCKFPPLRLNFKKSQVKDTLFDGQDKLKLVTHCVANSSKYEQAVLAEYLVYRMLNILTDISFRVRLLNITYANDANEAGHKAYAILIEDDSDLADRLGLQVLKVDGLSTSQLDAEYLNLTELFQYLIGNTDFAQTSVAPGRKCCHNHRPLGREGEPSFAVPYDFDMAGMVNAPHAAPNPSLRLYSVKERLYRGRCSSNDLLPASIDYIANKRDDIETVVREQTEMTEKGRKYMLDYLDSYYQSVDSDKRVRKNLIKPCR